MLTVKISRSCKGSSLIEVLITLLIFAVGLLGFAGLQVNALQSTADSGQRSQAVWINQELAERMRANTEAGNAIYIAAAANVDCANLPTNICSDYYDPTAASKVNAAVCNATQMAAFDLWEAQCSYSSTPTYQGNANAANGRYNSRDFLTRPAGATPPLAVTAQGNGLRITSNWLSTGSRSSTGITTGENLSTQLEVLR